jgi:Bacteriophage HK97-gp10, putative tail-component
MDISVDVSELNELIAMLERAAERPRKERAGVLRKIGAQVASEARSNASSWFTKASTGRLAEGVTVEGRGVSRVAISSPYREGFFLEYGSPNTGAPRPWLTQPAERGVESLLEELGKMGEVW